MLLFVANPTKQNNHLYYRVPEIARLLEEVVPAGGQIQIAKHLNPTKAQLDGILTQLESNGCVPANAVNRAKDKRFVLVYQWGTPVDVDKIAMALEKNDHLLQDVSDEQFKETAEGAIHAIASLTNADPTQAEIKVIENVNGKGGKKSRDVRTAQI